MTNGFYGIRSAYVMLAWFVLLGSVHNSESHIPILAGFILYVVPLSLDYWSHTPVTIEDENRKKIGVWVPVYVFTIFLGVLLVDIEKVNDFITLKFVKYTLWGLSSYFIYLAVNDFIAYSEDEEEREARRKTREKKREKAEEERESQEARREYYQKTKPRTFIVNKNRKRSKGGKKK